MRVILAGLLASVTCFLSAETADAQVNCAVASPQPVTSPGIPAGAAGSVTAQPAVVGGIVGQTVLATGVTGTPMVIQAGSVGVPEGTMTTLPSQGPVLPYSYWVSAPSPARVYVEYGVGDPFPFYGRPYGSPGDRWSWYNMGGGSSRYLARYYYPPLR
jgi:hypothetical protein